MPPNVTCSFSSPVHLLEFHGFTLEQATGERDVNALYDAPDHAMMKESEEELPKGMQHGKAELWQRRAHPPWWRVSGAGEGDYPPAPLVLVADMGCQFNETDDAVGWQTNPRFQRRVDPLNFQTNQTKKIRISKLAFGSPPISTSEVNTRWGTKTCFNILINLQTGCLLTRYTTTVASTILNFRSPWR